MPIGPYKDFDACVLAMKGKGHSQEEARRMCGAMARDQERDKAEMGALDGRWIEVFRAGDYGPKGKYTEQDIDQMIANYDPAHHEAPLVLGHPESDSPAMGWVEALKREGAVMLAKLKQVQPALEEMVRQGLFKKRSISFYRDPLALRHVGFLGAMPPGAKGLVDVKLASLQDGDRVFNAIDFNQEEEMEEGQVKKTVLETLREFFGVHSKAPAADSQGLSEDQAKKLVNEAVAEAGKQFTAELGKRDAQITELTTKLDERAKAEQKSSVTALAEGEVAKLKAAGKWIPAYAEMGVPALFTELAGSQAKIVFGEGDKKTEKAPLQVFADFLNGLPKIVPMAEIAKGASAARKG